MKKEPRDYTITALERGLKVLMLFDGEKSSYTLTELSQLSGIGKSTMLRIVYTFCENGFLTFDENTRRYSLGVCVFRLGMAKMNTLDFRRIALRYLRPLSRETDMICYLGVRQEDMLIMVEQVVPSSVPVWAQLMVRTGGETNLYATGIGRLFLAQDTDEEVAAYLDRTAPKQITPETVTDKQKILAMVRCARAEEFDVNQGESDLYIASLCAPVYDVNGRMVAGISLCGIKEQINGANRSEYERMVRQTAAKISEQLGYMKR